MWWNEHSNFKYRDGVKEKFLSLNTLESSIDLDEYVTVASYLNNWRFQLRYNNWKWSYLSEILSINNTKVLLVNWNSFKQISVNFKYNNWKIKYIWKLPEKVTGVKDNLSTLSSEVNLKNKGTSSTLDDNVNKYKELTNYDLLAYMNDKENISKMSIILSNWIRSWDNSEIDKEVLENFMVKEEDSLKIEVLNRLIVLDPKYKKLYQELLKLYKY